MNRLLPSIKNLKPLLLAGTAWGFIFFGAFGACGVLLANGGAPTKETEHYEIQFAHNPLSPLTGENVNMSFVILDKAAHKPVGDVEAKLLIVETNLDTGLDRRLHEADKKSDERGIINHSYAFPNDAIYTLRLSVTSANDQRDPESVEFYLQAREGKESAPQLEPTPVPVEKTEDSGVASRRLPWLLQMELVLAGVIAGGLLTIGIQKLGARGK